MSMMMRRGMMVPKAPGGLPSEYLQVQYLESTGAQYIDTGLLYQASDVIDVDVVVMDGNTDHCVFGAYASGKAELNIQKSSTRYYFRYDLTFISSSIAIGTKYHVRKSGATWSIDGVEESNQGKNDSTNSSLYLFGRNYNGANKLSKVRIYSYKHSRNNVELMSLVPCIRIADSKPGMFDLVGRTFYTNSGTGEFLYDTTAQILVQDEILYVDNNQYTTKSKTNGGVTIMYKMDTPTKVLYPAGVIPHSGIMAAGNNGCMIVFDSNKQPFNYVAEKTGTSPRWAQDADGTTTEFSQSWTLNSEYSYIQFSVDTRYLADAYMYDKTSGQIWFAGVNTPYYGHHNISELS